MDQSSEKRENYTPEILVIAGYVIFFCLAFVFYFAYLFSLAGNLQQSPPPVNEFATSLPPTTPTPQINITNQPNETKIFNEDFSSDSNGWSFSKDERSATVTNSQLRLESKKEDWYAYASCSRCPYLDKPFYFQVDFSTATPTDNNIGILFNLNNVSDSFFVFQINTEAKKYYLRHHINDSWSLRSAGESSQIKSFPAVNVLGVSANQDTVELYINGEIVDSYKQSGYAFQRGDFGVYVSDSGFQLIVDNLIINNIGVQ